MYIDVKRVYIAYSNLKRETMLNALINYNEIIALEKYADDFI